MNKLKNKNFKKSIDKLYKVCYNSIIEIGHISNLIVKVVCFMNREYTKEVFCGDIIYHTKGKHGEYELIAPSQGIESWTVWFTPYENKSAPIHDRWYTWTFVPDGTERIQYRCERRIDAERMIDEWERKV